MSFKETFQTVYDLSLKPYEAIILTILSIWYGAIIAFYSIPYFSFLYNTLFYLLISLVLPFIVLFGILLVFFYTKFSKIIISDENFYLNPSFDDYYSLPNLVISEYFVTRFSFKLRLYCDMPSKFQGKKIVLIIIKAPTINISIKPKKQLHQEFSDREEIFYLKQDYELNSSELSFVLYIQADGAVNTKKLDLYITCEESLEKFLEEFKNDPKTRPHRLICEKNFYLST